MTPAAPTPIEDLLAAPLGLRERKKLKTRRAIRAAAFRLFTEQGYDGTTVDQIADAAEVSPSTFFRYFPTKEDLVVGDEYDPVMEAALRARPAGEPVLESMRQSFLPALRQIVTAEPEEMLLRMRLMQENAVIRARSAAEMIRTVDLLAGILSDRTGEPRDSLELRAVVAAVTAACGQAVEHWAQHGGSEDVVTLVERSLDAVAAAFSA
ncbi:TetR family transcriptional regulator [Streptacidiphilus sp. EB129]|uniref:TetR family transcriptional regulator n=1 Tax=Streptacidiphilus sp. EB129 TaxID=3156262 RepID=UPI003518A67B